MYCAIVSAAREKQLCLAVLQSHNPSTTIRRDVGLCNTDMQGAKV